MRNCCYSHQINVSYGYQHIIVNVHNIGLPLDNVNLYKLKHGQVLQLYIFVHAACGNLVTIH